MSKFTFLLLILMVFFGNATAQQFTTTDRAYFRALALLFESKPLAASTLRYLVSKLDLEDVAVLGEYSLHRCGRFQDRVLIKNPYSPVKMLEVPEGALLNFINYLESATSTQSPKYQQLGKNHLFHLTAH
jgi:hypothetical protein